MKEYNFKFNSDEIMSAMIRKGKGYNYCSVYLNKDDHYIDINYEWSDDNIPDFAVDVLAFIGTKETSSETKKEIAAFQERLKCL